MSENLRQQSRRMFISTSAAAMTAAATGVFGGPYTNEYSGDYSGKPVSVSEGASIRPFRVNIPERDLVELQPAYHRDTVARPGDGP